MSVGLYDVDFFKYHQIMFNLEIMKMSTYFKGKREITQLSPSYSPERYTHFYLRKDYYDGSFPVGLNKYENLQYGGLAFTNNVYVPLPLDIEATIPDNYVYDRHSKLFVEGPRRHGDIYKTLTRNKHLRLSLDGKTVWKNFEKQLSGQKTVVTFFHDVDLGKIENVKDTVSYLLQDCSSGAKSIGAKFPISINGYDDFGFWSQYSFNDSFLTLRITHILDDEEFVELITKSKKSQAESITYTIADASSSADDFIKFQLPRIFKQVIFCCRQRKRILLNIDDDFHIAQEWRDLVTLFNLYMSAAQSYTNGTLPALYLFCKSLKTQDSMRRSGILCKEDARRIFEFVYNHHPELFKLFYECNTVELINGGLEDVSPRN